MVTDDLATIFSDVAQQLQPDLTVVIAQATRRGRRLRARRRIAIALSAGATVGAVAVATILGAQLAHRPAQGPQSVAPSGHHTTKLKPKLKPRPKPGLKQPKTPVPQQNGPGQTASEMLSILRTLLPAGQITGVIPYEPYGGVEVNFADGDGRGAVDVNVGVYATGGPPSSLECPNVPLKDEGKRPAGAAPISCTTSVLAGGGGVVMKEFTEADFAGYYDLAVYVARPDGVTVAVDVANGTLDGTPHEGRQGWPWVDRAVPPGSFAIWEQVVRSPKWHL
jgi:hypothetical protein